MANDFMARWNDVQLTINYAIATDDYRLLDSMTPKTQQIVKEALLAGDHDFLHRVLSL